MVPYLLIQSVFTRMSVSVQAMAVVTGWVLLLGLTTVSSRFPSAGLPQFPYKGSQQGGNKPHAPSSSNNNGGSSRCSHQNHCNFKSKYRAIDGSCNNEEITTWGQVDTRFARILPPRYSDGADKIPASVNGTYLPNARNLHLNLFPFINNPAKKYSLSVMQWGQLLAHDTALSSGQPNAGDCCPGGKAKESSSCASISLSYEDPYYGKFNRSCMSVVRTANTKSEGCKITPALQLSGSTHFIDLSLTYGSKQDVSKQLRTFQRGLLKTQIVNGKQYCPSASKGSCDPRSKVCYLAGDVRVNQNPGITSLQILILREHNRVASELYKLNPRWNDETIYQETRRIVIAEAQQITYYEWLPIIIGKPWDSLGKKYIDYDVKVDPSTINVFTAGCYRYFHSLVQGKLQFIDESGEIKKEIPLRDYFNRPQPVQEDFDGMLLGLAKQPAQTADPYFTEDLGNYLFKGTKSFGDDLEAIDITRGRDHGLPSYNKIREFCGSRPAKSFTDYEDLIEKGRLWALSAEYSSPEDVDMFVGTTYEKKVESSLLGPTCQCVIIEQFRRWRVGDRYFFDHPNQVGSFTEEQRKELRKASLARLMCDNGNNISRIQKYAFLQVSDENYVQKCEELPYVSLQPWKS